MIHAKASAMAVALSLGLITPAQAEDWTGTYLTFGLSSASTDLHTRSTGASFPAGSTDDIAPFAAVGHDWARGNLTFGVVADIDLTGVAGYDADLVTSGKGFYGESDWFATFRGRVGAPVNDKLHVFASGGIAVTRAGGTNVGLFGSNNSDMQLLTGAAVGLGMEYALPAGGHLSIEYLYADFGRSDEIAAPPSPFVAPPGTVEPIISTVRVGYTLRF